MGITTWTYVKAIRITFIGSTKLIIERLLLGEDPTTAGTIVVAVAGIIGRVEIMTTGLIGKRITIGARAMLGSRAQTIGTAEMTIPGSRATSEMIGRIEKKRKRQKMT